MNQKDVWNKIASQWKEYRKNPSEEIIRFSEGKKGKVLDICCGNCRQLIPFKGNDLFGIDFSENMIEKAKEFCKEYDISTELKVSEATSLPFKDSFFDVVLFLYSLHNLNEEDRKTALKEMIRVMKPGGNGIISVWLKKEKGDKELYWGVDEDETVYRYYHFFGKEELENLLISVGFIILESYISGTKEKNIFVEVQKPLKR